MLNQTKNSSTLPRNLTKVSILKEVNFGKMQLCRVEHFYNIFVLTFGCDCWIQLQNPYLVQFSKFDNFLWVCWFFSKNLSNFVSSVWNLHNPYCHNVLACNVVKIIWKIGQFENNLADNFLLNFVDNSGTVSWTNFTDKRVAVFHSYFSKHLPSELKLVKVSCVNNRVAAW